MRVGSDAIGCSRMRRDAAVWWLPLEATSMTPPRSCRTQLHSTSASRTRSGERGRCSRSASSAGASGRSAPRATRSARRSTGFEELGAATWVAKAHAELGRIGGRTRTEGLTPAERRVAALVAEGRTNREVAAALFLGRAHGRDAPVPRLRQARRALAGRARADVSARRAKFRGTRDFKLSALAYGRACAELPRRDVPRTRRRR